ncbi:ABC transporter substrate-binding protein [Natronospirillum operosum]|uniref:ABC transporter substrate-binding protein n=1 Tax=Natronospirillum operosum TaxID=2759953 RepID=A0A4Z0WGY9_9GAMM|nr:ABC transporter substrate-binding protein [Natronospirillum operosum]TGG93910.1 ABC transporter substrate-binding protein [Natronospirillum operosum]
MRTMITATAVAFMAMGVSPGALADQDRHVLTVNIEIQSSWSRNFNPFNETTRLRSTREFIYEPLVIYNVFDQGQPHYRLAISDDYADDLMSIAFDLREGVTWSDGEPFTAEDVVFTYEMIRDEPALDLWGMWDDRLESVEAEGDHRVIFHLQEVYTGVHERIAEVPVVPMHIWSEVSDPVSYANTDPVGSGPFTEIDRFSSQIYVQCRNPHYWDNDNLEVDCLRFPQLGSNDNVLLAGADGELDWFGSFIPDIDQTYVAHDPDHHHYWLPPGSLVGMVLNLNASADGNREAFNDINFRRAFSMAMDRQAMVNVAGYGYPTINQDPSGLGELYALWADADILAEFSEFMDYDLDAAGALLAEAGYEDSNGDGYLNTPSGESIRFELIVPNGWTDWVNTVRIAVSDLQDLGLNVEARTPEVAAWDEAYISGEFTGGINSWLPGVTPHRQIDGAYHPRFVDRRRDAAARYHNDELVGLLEQFYTVAEQSEQETIMHEMQAILSRDMPIIPVFNNPMWYQYNDSRFTGWWNADNPGGRPQPHAGNPERLLHVLDLSPRN